MPLFNLMRRRTRLPAQSLAQHDGLRFSDADLADMGIKRYQLEEAMAR